MKKTKTPKSVTLVAVAARKLLKAYLDNCLENPELLEPSPAAMAHIAMLQSATEGLEALDHGEVLPIFQPASGKWGESSYKIWKCRLRALGLVALLRSVLDHKRKPEFTKAKAQAIVGAAYCVAPSTIKKWESRLAEPDPSAIPLSKLEVVGLYKSSRRFRGLTDTPEDNPHKRKEIFAQIKTAAAAYKIAIMEKKKPGTK